MCESVSVFYFHRTTVPFGIFVNRNSGLRGTVGVYRGCTIVARGRTVAPQVARADGR